MFGRKKIKHPSSPSLYHYHIPRPFNPGAAILVFDAKYALPIIQPQGAGKYTGAMRVTQPPQQFVAPSTLTVGLGGIQAGQMAMQPLIDNTGGN